MSDTTFSVYDTLEMDNTGDQKLYLAANKEGRYFKVVLEFTDMTKLPEISGMTLIFEPRAGEAR